MKQQFKVSGYKSIRRFFSVSFLKHNSPADCDGPYPRVDLRLLAFDVFLLGAVSQWRCRPSPVRFLHFKVEEIRVILSIVLNWFEDGGYN